MIKFKNGSQACKSNKLLEIMPLIKALLPLRRVNKWFKRRLSKN